MDPLAFLIAGMAIWGLAEIIRSEWLKSQHGELIATLTDEIEAQTGESIEEYARKRRQGLPTIFMWLSIGPIIILLVDGSTQMWQLIIMGLLILAGNYLRPWNELVSSHARQVGAMERKQERQQRQARPMGNPFSGFGSKADDDDGFFARREDPPRSKARPDPEPDPAPRGFEERHPDEAKFWAVVDDPNAPDGERRNAFEMILRAKARRNEPAESGDEILKLLGYSR